MEIHDTSGDEHLNMNRQVQYNKANVFIICVATNQPSSFENVLKWAVEIKAVVPQAPIILCRCKEDLEDLIESPLTEEMIRAKSSE